MLSQTLTKARSLAGADAGSRWALFRTHERLLLLASHMGGTPEIPRAQIRTACYSEDTGTPRLRLAYDADPSGKPLDDADATPAWTALRG